MSVGALSSVEDYIGRRIDLWVLAERAPGMPVIVSLSGTDGQGKATVGPLKLAQRVAMKLFTPLGSVAFLPEDEGTDFMNDFYRNRWQSIADVQDSFDRASFQLQDQVLAEEYAEMPSDERFGSLILNTATIAEDHAAVDLTVRSRAGSAARLIYPLAAPA